MGHADGGVDVWPETWDGGCAVDSGVALEEEESCFRVSRQGWRRSIASLESGFQNFVINGRGEVTYCWI